LFLAFCSGVKGLGRAEWLVAGALLQRGEGVVKMEDVRGQGETDANNKVGKILPSDVRGELPLKEAPGGKQDGNDGTGITEQLHGGTPGRMKSGSPLLLHGKH
jgi:hypothetical protein